MKFRFASANLGSFPLEAPARGPSIYGAAGAPARIPGSVTTDLRRMSTSMSDTNVSHRLSRRTVSAQATHVKDFRAGVDVAERKSRTMAASEYEIFAGASHIRVRRRLRCLQCLETICSASRVDPGEKRIVVHKARRGQPNHRRYVPFVLTHSPERKWFAMTSRTAFWSGFWGGAHGETQFQRVGGDTCLDAVEGVKHISTG